MKLKIILLCIAIILLSGCIDGNTGNNANLWNGKYICNNSDTLRFEIPDLLKGNIFYATEYMEFTQQTVELTGVYEVVGDELIMKYKLFGAVRRFNITNNSHTLIETDAGQMRFDWVGS